MKAVMFVVVLVAACGKDAAPAKTSDPVASGPKRFWCEKIMKLCYVPGAHQDEFLHYSDCTPQPDGQPAFGCSPQDNAFCYQTAKSLVCIATHDECDAVVTGQRTGSARVPKLAPVSDCSERKASAY